MFKTSFLVGLALWVVISIIAIGVTWRYTVRLEPQRRMFVRCGVLAFCIGTAGVGSDAFVIPVPIMIYLYFQPTEPVSVVVSWLIHFGLVVGIYSLLRYLRGRLTSESRKREA